MPPRTKRRREVPAPPRELTDPKTMRALAHPIRLALIEALTLEGELTATQAGELVGESPASCSFHLRQLAKYGFVEETGGGAGRQRPWRMKTIGTHMEVRSSTPPETAIAAGRLTRMYHERALDRLRKWWEDEPRYPDEWRAVAGSNETIWWITPAELQELNEQLEELVYAYRDRMDPDKRPEGSLPVEFLTFAFPVRAPDEPAKR